MFIPQPIRDFIYTLFNDPNFSKHKCNQASLIDDVQTLFNKAKETGTPSLSSDEIKIFFDVFSDIIIKHPYPGLMLFGLILLRGAENEKDHEKAIKALKFALEHNNVFAGYLLAEFYTKNKSELIDDTTIFNWYLQTAEEQNYAPAKYAVALCFQKGRGTLQNFPSALKYFTEAANLGYAPAQYKVGIYYLHNTEVINKLAAISSLEYAAIQGYPPALYQLGLCYLNDIGIIPNLVRAINCFKDAGRRGYPPALYQLGLCYLNGIGTIQNLADAKNHFEKAANLGYTPALYQLGLCYLNGIGTIQNLFHAIECFINAGNQGYIAAYHQLGEIYSLTVPDASLAVYWFDQAAKLGHAKSQFNLGYLYAIGHGVQINYLAAVDCFIKASEQDYPLALHYLGMCYIYGLGVEANYLIALDYLELAARTNIPDGEKDLIEIIHYITLVNETKTPPDLDTKNLSELIQIAKNIINNPLPTNPHIYIQCNFFDPPQPLPSAMSTCNTMLPFPKILQNQL